MRTERLRVRFTAYCHLIAHHDTAETRSPMSSYPSCMHNQTLHVGQRTQVPAATFAAASEARQNNRRAAVNRATTLEEGGKTKIRESARAHGKHLSHYRRFSCPLSPSSAAVLSESDAEAASESDVEAAGDLPRGRFKKNSTNIDSSTVLEP